MAFDFTCTHCGRRLTQEEVLFEFPAFLFRGKKGKGNPKESEMRIRLTQKEVQGLAKMGGRNQTQGKAPFRLTLQDALRFKCNANNLELSGIENLTQAELKAYMTTSKSAKTKEELQAHLQNKQSAKEKMRDVFRNKHSKEPKLKGFLELFRHIDVLEGEIEPIIHRTNTVPVVTGFMLYNRQSELLDQCCERVCRFCGKKVFRGAGTAEQRSVVFVGNRNSGKASAIVAVVNHLWHNGTGAAREQLKYQNIELLDLSGQVKELNQYTELKVPDKPNKDEPYSFSILLQTQKDQKLFLTLTDVPEDRYDEINGRIQAGPFFADADAYVVCIDMYKYKLQYQRETAIREMVPRLDVEFEDFVIQMLKKCGPGDDQMLDCEKLCHYIDDLQNMRQDAAGTPGAKAGKAPVLVLYNKEDWIPDLAEIMNGKASFPKIFPKEAAVCEKDMACSGIFKKLRGSISDCYYAQLRCSPFGSIPDDNGFMRERVQRELQYAKEMVKIIEKETGDPKYRDSEKEVLDAVHKKAKAYREQVSESMDKLETQHGLAPQNVDKLAQWLLCVTGCIPIPLTVPMKEKQGNKISYIDQPQEYWVDPPECRMLLPCEQKLHCPKRPLEVLADLVHCKDWLQYHAEAKARQYLFENSEEDSDYARRRNPTQMGRQVWNDYRLRRKSRRR